MLSAPKEMTALKQICLTPLGLPAMRRIMHYENYSSRVRLNATGGREWYWYNLVVRPEAQGQHLVGKLLRPMLEYCARNGRPAYLETHSEKNVGIYRHFGFNAVSDNPIPGTEVTHWGDDEVGRLRVDRSLAHPSA